MSVLSAAQKAVIYVRTTLGSGEEQQKNKLDKQKQDCIAYAQRRGYEVVATFEDVVSLTGRVYPGWSKANEFLKSTPIDFLIASRPAYLPRNVQYSAPITNVAKQQGTQIIVVMLGPETEPDQ